MSRDRKGQRGAILVLTAFLLPFIILFTGLAVDAGNAYVHHSKLQNSVDAAALAGGYKYAEKKSQADTKSKVDEYMKINQGESSYSIDNIDYKTGTEKGVTDITVTASEQIPIFFLGPAMKLFHVDITDEEAENWNIKATATVRVKEGGSDTVPDIPDSIFDYAMIGGYTNPVDPNHSYNYLWDSSFNSPIEQAMMLNTDHVTIKGRVHSNGPIYLPVQDSKNGTYPIYVENFSCAADKDADLWLNYKDNYDDHYQKRDGEYGLDKPEGIAVGHQNDDKIPGNSGPNHDMSWRFYARFGTLDHQDYTAQGAHSDIIDISLGRFSTMTKPVLDFIEKCRKMSFADREKNYIYVDTDGDYSSLWSKGHTGPTYQLNSSANNSVYPAVTCGSFKIANQQYYEEQGWDGTKNAMIKKYDIWHNVYKIVIVDGNLDINIPANTSPANASDHAIFISLHGDIHLQNNSPFYGYLYAPQGTVLIDGSQPVYGSVVAQSIRLTSSVAIEYRNFGMNGNSNGGSNNSGGSSGGNTSGNASVTLIK
ncbi:MAG: Tad domain-containing protein [Mitsuokella sp.]|uniref:Tad domain-containing protein n=1 Tax=Mitsuokella sp. TaxID=2049034 RepID=UPI003EFC36AD